MIIKLQNGSVISTDNKELIEQHLKYGGVEVRAKSKPDKTVNKDKSTDIE